MKRKVEKNPDEVKWSFIHCFNQNNTKKHIQNKFKIFYLHIKCSCIEIKNKVKINQLM